MAGDWIKMRVDLDSDPAVIRMARRLGVGETTIVGCLHNIWSWADKQTVDGCVDGIASTWLDRRVYLPDFAAAMIEVGWLEELPNGGGIRFPKFEKHNGETAKNRASKSETQAKWRAKKAAQCVDSFVDNGESTTTPTREEKRREDISTPSPKAPATAKRFPEFWLTWPNTDRKAGKAKCEEKWKRFNCDAIADQILAHVAALKQTRKWQEGFEPAPMTYLNGKLWLDGEVAATKAWEGAI
jgi:hypothetical protein